MFAMDVPCWHFHCLSACLQIGTARNDGSGHHLLMHGLDDSTGILRCMETSIATAAMLEAGGRLKDGQTCIGRELNQSLTFQREMMACDNSSG